MHPIGAVFDYSYRELTALCDEARVTSVSNQIAQSYAKLTNQWSVELNSEWTCRTYFATKMILNATALLNSLNFSRLAGLRAANPYFEYYATLSLIRGLVSTLPAHPWKSGELWDLPHTKAINLAFDWVAKFDKATAARLKQVTLQLKAQRELIAYKAPASGDANLEGDYNLIELLTILAEVAQYNSEILELSITKNADPSVFQVLDEHVQAIATIEIGGFVFSDDDDYHRLDYVQRKLRRPRHLASFMQPGQSEDFMGAWDGDGDNGEPFSQGSPSNWQAIFDVP